MTEIKLIEHLILTQEHFDKVEAFLIHPEQISGFEELWANWKNNKVGDKLPYYKTDAHNNIESIFKKHLPDAQRISCVVSVTIDLNLAQP